VIADLHVGWEIALAQGGIHVPSQTPKILSKLLQIIDLCEPTGLLFLGDVKHTIAKAELEEWQDIPRFFEALITRVSDIKVVMGNHDGNLEPLLPESVKLMPSTGIAIGDAGFFHGNAWPAPELLACRSLIMGHVHPTVAFNDPMGFRTTAQVWVKAKLNGELLARAFLKSLSVQVEANVDAVKLLFKKVNVRLKASELFVMPYFNDFLGGRPINRSGGDRRSRSIEYLGPVLRSGSVDFDNAETYLLDGSFLGTIGQLKSFS
jgi:putative SbcD/Mre11-related phosphoesterase